MSLRTPRTLVQPAVRLWIRQHSSSSTPPSFVPLSHTSADTRIPYGDPSCASSAYLPRDPGASASSADGELDPRATTETPQLDRRQRDILEKIIRVDQAGELGANYIYRGQRAVLGLGTDRKTTDLVQVRPVSPSARSATAPKLTPRTLSQSLGDVGRREEAHRCVRQVDYAARSSTNGSLPSVEGDGVRTRRRHRCPRQTSCYGVHGSG